VIAGTFAVYESADAGKVAKRNRRNRRSRAKFGDYRNSGYP